MRVRIECAEYSNRGVKKACSVNPEEGAAEGATSGKASPEEVLFGLCLDSSNKSYREGAIKQHIIT